MNRARVLPLLALLAASACVSVQPAPDPRGAVRPGQRLVVVVYQAPGPWIHADADSKAEAAAKILPIGFMMQGLQEERINELSKEIQPYLPRPRYDAALERELIAALKRLHDGPVETAVEAAIPYALLREFNGAQDPLEWRRRYFYPDPGARAPRDYARVISLDGSIIVEVNLHFGTTPLVDEKNPDANGVLPALTAMTRLYDGGTVRRLWEREDLLTDRSATMSLTEYRAQPVELTRRLEALAPELGRSIATNMARALGLRPPPPPPPTQPPPAPEPPPVAVPELPPVVVLGPLPPQTTGTIAVEVSSPAASVEVSSPSTPAPSPVQP